MSIALYDKEVSCPVCAESFKTKKVRTSTIKVIKRDTDFCAHYNGENPTFYGVYVCPKCGYTSFESQYDRITGPQIEKIRQGVMANWSGRAYGDVRSLRDAIDVHKLALVNFRVMEASKFLVAKACLRLSWFYRMQGDLEKEMLFISHAEQTYEQAFTSESIEDSGEEEYLVYYLLGELNRRLGEYRKSINYFDKCIRHPEIFKKRQIKLMAQEQRMEASEAYRRQKVSVGESGEIA